MKRIYLVVMAHIILFHKTFFCALSTTFPGGIVPSFGFGSFLGNDVNSLYVAADEQGSKENALSRIQLLIEEEEQPTLFVTPFASAEAYVNAIPEDREKKIPAPIKTANPLYNNYFGALTFLSFSPVVLMPNDPQLGSYQKLIAALSAESVITTTNILNDAAGNPCNGIVSIEGSRSYVFAALTPHSGAFGTGDCGLSLVMSDSNQLVIPNAQSGLPGGNKAVLFNRAAGVLMAIEQDASMGSIIDMYWDSVINRLFIALKLERADATQSGGCVSLLVGRIDSSDPNNPHKLIIDPAVPLQTTAFVRDSNEFMIGFLASAGGANRAASLYKVRTLHTSTARSYVIVNGDVGVGDFKNRVYALPIVAPSTGINAVTPSPFGIGKIAQIVNPYTPAFFASDLPRSSDKASLVGAGSLPNNAADDIADMFVAGDSVYVCLAGGQATSSGIFKSSPFFDNVGLIAGWSPWQRVMGSADPVLAAGFDKRAGQFLYLTKDTSSHTSEVKATVWGNGAGDTLLGGYNGRVSQGLVSVLAAEFPPADGGVLALNDCDNATPSFTPINSTGNLGLIIATGSKKIALIESGLQAAGSVFTPTSGDFLSNSLYSTTGFSPAGSLGTKALFVSGGILDKIGPFSTCDVSRVDASGISAPLGYLFVGGRNGIAVLSEDNGNGWVSSGGVGLSSGFVGITSTMSFKQIGSISNVRKIMCDNSFVYILTSNAFYKIALNSSQFSSAGVQNPSIITLGTSLSLAGDSNAIFYDFLISSKIALVGTSAGLFRSGDGANIQSATSAIDAAWTPVLLSLPPVPHNLITKPYPAITQLDMLSAVRGSYQQGGTVYVLAVEPARNLSYAYRFSLSDTSGAAVSSSSLSPIAEPDSISYFMALGEGRSYVKTDGTLFFQQSSKRFNESDFLQFITLMKNTSINSLRGFSVDFENGNPNTYRTLGLLVRNSSSGAWMLPGEFGIRVDE